MSSAPAPAPTPAPPLSTWQSLKAVGQSWRLGSVALLMFSSSLPLGLVWITVPAWMQYLNADIKVIGIFALTQAPWSFKFLWAPLVDRYPLPFLGRKRGWIFATQVVMLLCGLGLAAAARNPGNLWVIGALAFVTAMASATHDIAYDGYAVEVLKREEQGIASGARVALGRLAMFVSGGIAITVAVDYLSWSSVNFLIALCYLPMLVVTWKAPEPEVSAPAPRSMREAVWEPFVGFLATHRAVEILAFVILFKLSDNLTQALLRPFFVQMGYPASDVGFGSMLIGTIALAGGATLAGAWTQRLGLGRALWIFGFLQIFSNLGYAVVAVMPTRAVLYAAQAFEMGTSGLGTAAYMVLLLRLTQKRFSTTQYALFSSLMAITRVFTGPPAALLVDALGWRDFFIATLLAGVPGMLMLRKFVPWSLRDPEFVVAPPSQRAPLTVRAVAMWSALTAAACLALSVATVGSMAALRVYNAGKTKATVSNVGPEGVEMRIKMAESSLAGGVKAIKDVIDTVPADEFETMPAVGDRVTIVQAKDAAGVIQFSRKRVLERQYDARPAFRTLLLPGNLDEWATTVGLLVFALVTGFAAAATLVARRGVVKAQGRSAECF